MGPSALNSRSSLVHLNLLRVKRRVEKPCVAQMMWLKSSRLVASSPMVPDLTSLMMRGGIKDIGGWHLLPRMR